MKLIINKYCRKGVLLLIFFGLSTSFAQNKNIQTLNYSHGNYVGDVVNGKANGQGTYTAAKTGIIYSGQFVNDTFSGQGTMLWKNGDKFVGIWQNDSAVNGEMTFFNNRTASGTVRNGVFKEDGRSDVSKNVVAPVSTEEPLFNLLNKSTQSITGIYISAPEDDNWGKNQVRSSLSPGYALVVGRLGSKCIHDVRVTYQNNTEEVMSKVDLCKLKQHEVLGEVLIFNGNKAKASKNSTNSAPSIPAQFTGQTLLDCKTVNCTDHQAVISAVRSAWSTLRNSANPVAKAYGDGCFDGLKEIQKAPQHMIGDRGYYENFMAACNAGLYELRK